LAATVSWEGLRELAGFRAENGRAITLYLGLDPQHAANAGDARTRVNSLLDEGVRRAASERNDLTHDQRLVLRDDLERIRRFVELELDRDGARGLVVFCDSADNFWLAIPLATSVSDAVKINDEFFLTPLVPIVGRGEGALVAAIGRERGELYRLRVGRLEEIGDHSEDQPRRHDQGGWAQARMQRHVDQLAHAHLRRVAEALDRQLRLNGRARLVVVSTDEIRAEFAALLSPAAKSALIGWTSAEAHAGPRELLDAALPVLEEWRGTQEAEAVERWREEAGRNGRGVAGWHETLEAASDGRIELLLYQLGVQRGACRCPACGRLAADAGKCPLDGTELEQHAEGLDLAIHQTLARGGTAWAVEHRRDLDPVGGIGALLRF
jgi:peptide chain release factor subunit 1